MSQYAAKTEVPIEKTRAEIEAVVRRFGADSYFSGYEGAKAMLQFRCAGRFVRLTMTLPGEREKRFTTYYQGSVSFLRSETAQRKLWDQACRQKWRALLLLVKAKLAAIDAGIGTFEEEFFAHVILPNGQTIYERAQAPVAIAYETGDMQAFLPGPGR